jgi:1,4-dihydroxy-2-naphthoate octaprenyltransferase
MDIKKAFRAIRVPFLTASVIPVLLGSSIVLAASDQWSTLYFLLTLVGVVSLHAATNLANEYFDYRSGNDVVNNNRSPFNGGSGVLVDGVYRPVEIKNAYTGFFIVSLAIAAYLSLEVGWPVMLIAIFGVLSGYYYSAPPVYLASRGLGELFVGLNFGLLVVLGTYYVQTGSFSMEAIYASLPVGLLISAVLLINQFPDYEADKAVGKKNLVVRLGKEKGVWIYIAMVVSAYVLIFLGPLLGMMPFTAHAALLPGLLAFKGFRILRSRYDDPRALLPANALTIKLHFFTGLLLTIGYLLKAWLP